MAAAIMLLHTMMLNLTHFLEWHFDLNEIKEKGDVI